MAEVADAGRRHAAVRLRGGAVEGSVAYLRAGQGAPVVLIHGVGMNADVWRPQVRVLAAHHDVISMDMPGHGESTLPPDPARLEDYGEAVVGLLDALGIQRAALVGHSMGALVAMQVALRHPARVTRLVAMNAVFCRPPELKRAVEARADELDQKGVAASIDPTLARWFGDPVPDDLVEASALTRAALEQVRPEGYRLTYRLFASSDAVFAEALLQLVPPALFFTAEHDANSSPAMSLEMAARAPGGRAEILAGARHMMALTHPDAVNRSLLAFLAEAQAPAASLARAEP